MGLGTINPNSKVELKLVVFWIEMIDKTWDDGGWGRINGGSIRHTWGPSCEDCYYFRTNSWGGKGSRTERKKYSCKGLAKNAKYLWKESLSSASKVANKGGPPLATPVAAPSTTGATSLV